MGKRQAGGVLARLAGKTVCFQGKFGWGEKDRLRALAEAQQGVIIDELDASVTHLVLPDLTAGKTVQKKAASLNAKGAAIQVLAANDFETFAKPTSQEVVALLRSGPAAAPLVEKVLGSAVGYSFRHNASAQQVIGEDFSKLDMTGFNLAAVAFRNCRFDGATLANAQIGSAEGCSFDDATCINTSLGVLNDCTARRANLAGAVLLGTLNNVDFTKASADRVKINGNHLGVRGKGKLLFTGASLAGAMIRSTKLSFADFQEANLAEASFFGTFLTECNFQAANLAGAMLMGTDLSKADLSAATLVKANLIDANLCDANLAGADVTGATLRGAKVLDEQLATAVGYDPGKSRGTGPGPRLQELDAITQKAKRIEITYRIEGAGLDPALPHVVTIDSAMLRWGWGLTLPAAFNQLYVNPRGAKQMSDTFVESVRVLGHTMVRFETVEVATTKSPMKANELRDVVIAALAEAFEQEPPASAQLAEMTKAYREAQREQSAAERERREQEKRQAEQAEAARRKQAEKAIQKQVGKVTDIATFLKALELRIEKAKIQKATRMLKAEGFKLFNDVKDDSMMGVIKSQTDPDLVYACRITSDGQYACCTQNLNICGGLRGSICKHLLVLIIGLVKAGELDPTTIDGWVARSNGNKAELDKEIMGEVFIRYKGAEAGEVDWRPTETVPEDYYAL